MSACRAVASCLLLAFLAAPTLACSGSISKGSPALRTLRNVFGVEFVDILLFGSNTSYSGSTYIRQPSDLNCDFEDPGNCLWSNYRSGGTDPRDNVDFFLFQKINARPWAGLPPGPTPPQGSQFLMAGDQSPKPSDAIWYSNPIRCQRSGRLSFHYNLYGVAKLEVLALVPGSDPVQDRIVLNINCPKHAPLATRRRKDGNRCVANIPAIGEPFQLAIRAFGLKNNFAIVDNIEYAGELCDGQSDVGDKFKLGPGTAHRSGLTGRAIRNVDEVECEDFDGCRWGNAPGGAEAWAVHSQRPSLREWRRHTGSGRLPTPNFLALQSKDGNAQANFVTDPLPCQSGTGRFSLLYWVTAGAELEACAIDYDTLEDIHCEAVGRAGAGRKRTFLIPGPITKPFFLSLEGRLPANGGFVAVDELAYDGDIDGCTAIPAPKGPANILDGLATGDMESGLTGETIEFPDDAGCDFSNEPIGGGRSEFLCKWGPGERSTAGRGANAEWKLVRGEVDPELLRETTGSVDGPDSEFSAIQFGKSGGLGLLKSDPMECQTDQGTLRLSYWLSEGVELRACPVDPTNGRSLNRPAVCTLVARGPAAATAAAVKVPNLASIRLKGFHLQIEASARGEGFALLDDIEYDAELENCISQPPTTTPDPKAAVLQRSCEKLSCSVQGLRGGMCNFRSLPRLPGDPQFRVQDGPVGGPTSNVQVGRNYPPRFYIGTVVKSKRRFPGQTSTSGDVAILRSSPFSIPRGATASFAFKHQRGIIGSQIWMCRNEFVRAIESRPLAQQSRCELVSGSDATRPWELNSVTEFKTTLRPGDYRVYIVATHPRVEETGPAGFLIDDLSLTLPNGQNLC